MHDHVRKCLQWERVQWSYKLTTDTCFSCLGKQTYSPRCAPNCPTAVYLLGIPNITTNYCYHYVTVLSIKWSKEGADYFLNANCSKHVILAGTLLPVLTKELCVPWRLQLVYWEIPLVYWKKGRRDSLVNVGVRMVGKDVVLGSENLNGLLGVFLQLKQFKKKKPLRQVIT